jgi:prepilin-type processing-associated H-X9-DG protein
MSSGADSDEILSNALTVDGHVQSSLRIQGGLANVNPNQKQGVGYEQNNGR